MRRVFLSSTARDLQAYRDEVFKAIQACDDLRVVRMEDFGARAEMTDEFCRTQVTACDLFVGIVGHYFGSSPKGSDKSYTQQEYDAAVETNRHRLMFVTPDDFSTPANLRESTKKYKLQQEFRKRVRANQPCPSFFSPQDLATKVVTAIRNHEIAPDFAAEEKRYLAQLIERTELLEFVGIPDPRQNAAIKLEDIFVPLGAEEEIERLPYAERELMMVESALEAGIANRESILSAKRELEVEVLQLRKSPRKETIRVSLDDALRAHMRLTILGDPGAGKSTLLRYLTLVMAQDIVEAKHASPLPEQRFPILIPLRRFAATNQSLVEFFYTYTKQTLQIELTRGLFEHALDGGRCIVLFDRLDEVFVSDQRVAVRDAVAAFANRYGHNNRIIVTSRIVGYESAPLDRRAFAHHTILPFTEKEIESFVHRWYAAREREPQQATAQAEQLCKTIKESDRLRKLAENPLMLTIIALVHRVEAELPNERVKLYDKCTESLHSTWEGVKGLAHDRERTYFKHRRRLLEKLAFWMHMQSQEAERQAEVKSGDLKAKLIAFLLEDPKLNLSADLAEMEAEAFIELAKSRTGILVERGDGIYSFVHLTFQEYFAACDLEKRYITDLERLWQEIQPHLYDARWREVILLLLGRLNEHDEPPSILVEKILREHDKFDKVVHRNLFLAAACLADRVNVHEQLQNEIVGMLLKFASAKRPKYNSLRNDSIQMLGNLRGNVRAGDALLALAQDEKVQSQIRCDAAQALGQLGRMDDAVRFLLTLAQVNRGMQYLVAEALMRLGRTDDAVSLFLTLSQDAKVSGGTRRIVAEALMQSGRKDDAVRLLLTLAQDAQVHEMTRRLAAQALGQLGFDEAVVVPGLLALAQDAKEDAGVRYSAAQALGRLGRNDNAVVPGLLALAQDEKEDAGVRYSAAQALGQLGRNDDAVQVLLALLKNEKVNVFEQIATVKTLGDLGYLDDAVQWLLTLSHDEDLEQDDEAIQALVQYNIAKALETLGRTHEAMQLLLALAQNEKIGGDNQAVAVVSLGRAEEAESVIPLLINLAQNKKIDWLVRQSAAQALGQLGKSEPRVTFVLLEITTDKDALVRNAAYDALKEVVGNLRYAEVSKQKAVGSKQKTKSKKRKSKTRNHK